MPLSFSAQPLLPSPLTTEASVTTSSLLLPSSFPTQPSLPSPLTAKLPVPIPSWHSTKPLLQSLTSASKSTPFLGGSCTFCLKNVETKKLFHYCASPILRCVIVTRGIVRSNVRWLIQHNHSYVETFVLFIYYWK